MQALEKFIDKLLSIGRYVQASLDTLRYAKKRFREAHNQKEEEETNDGTGE